MATAQRLLAWMDFFFFFFFNSSSGTKHRNGDILVFIFFYFFVLYVLEWDCRVGWVGWMGLVSSFFFSL